MHRLRRQRDIFRSERENTFEVNVLACIDHFLDQAVQTTAALEASEYLQLREKSLREGEVSSRGIHPASYSVRRKHDDDY